MTQQVLEEIETVFVEPVFKPETYGRRGFSVLKRGKIWQSLSSMTLALWLFAAIALVSLAGTLMPPEAASKLFHSGWFLALLTALSVNLFMCLTSRFALVPRMAGSLLTHGSILVILSGALIGLGWGESGFLTLDEGETAGTVVLNGRAADLGFSVRLNDFIYEESIDPKENLRVFSETGRFVASISAEAGSESEIAGTPYRVKILRYLPDFSMDLSTRRVISRSQEPRNPALEVELKNETGLSSAFWVFVAYPDVHNPVREGFKFKYHWFQRRPKDFVSNLSVMEGNRELWRGDIRVNEPLRFKGYSFFQSSYDQEHLNWSGLRVVKDPGVPVVYAGFGLLLLGLVLRYARPLFSRRTA